MEHLLTMILPLLMFVFVLKKGPETNVVFQERLILGFFVASGFLFWLNYSPVFRFAIHIFITLVFLFFSSILISQEF